MSSLFIERPNRYSTFIAGCDLESSSMDVVPQLSMLRIEFERVHPGMSDFIIRVATPKYQAIKSGVVLSIRGSEKMTKFDTVKIMADVIKSEMASRNDKTHDWENADAERLADLVYGPLKYFASQTGMIKLQFATEAL